MRDPLQIETTPYEVIGVERSADKKDIQLAFQKRILEKSTENIVQARNRLLKPVERAMTDVFMFCPAFLSKLIPKIRTPDQLSGKRDVISEKWGILEKNPFPNISATHSLAVLWYWWARYVTEQERIEKIKTLSSLEDIQGLALVRDPQTIWRNAISRWVFLINSENFFTEFPFALTLSEPETQELKDKIGQHFLSLFADYAYMYKEKGLMSEHEAFSYYIRQWKAEMNTANILSKAKDALPKGYLCGRLFFENLEFMQEIKSVVFGKQFKALSAKELERLQMQLSDYFFDIPNIVDDKQYEFALTRIEEGMKGIGAGDQPAKWLSDLKAFQPEDQVLIQQAAAIYADICFEVGKGLIGDGKFEEALKKFTLSQKVTHKTQREKDISKELIHYINNQAGYNVDKALYNIEIVLKYFNSESLHDEKAELLNKKAHSMGNQVIGDINKKVNDEKIKREDIIEAINRYREVIMIYEQAVNVAKSKAAIARHQSELVDNIKKNLFQMISPLVEGVSKTLIEGYYTLSKQNPMMMFSSSVSRGLLNINHSALNDLLRNLNIYYDKDQMDFLHMLFELKYCTSLIEKYSSSASSSGSWNEIIRYFAFFTDISDTEKRYSIFSLFRKGQYEKAAADYKSAFGTSSGLNKVTYDFYMVYGTEQILQALHDESMRLEDRVSQDTADMHLAREALTLHNKVKNFSPATTQGKQDKKEMTSKLKKLIGMVLSNAVGAAGNDCVRLKNIIQFIKELNAQGIQSEEYKQVQDQCAALYFTAVFDVLEKLAAKYESDVCEYKAGKALAPEARTAADYDKLERQITDAEGIVKIYGIADEKSGLIARIKERVTAARRLLLKTFAARNLEDIAQKTSAAVPEDNIEKLCDYITGILEAIEAYGKGLGESDEVQKAAAEMKRIWGLAVEGYYCENHETQAAYGEALTLKQDGNYQDALILLSNTERKCMSGGFKAHIQKIAFSWELESLDEKIHIVKQRFELRVKKVVEQDFTFEFAQKAAAEVSGMIWETAQYQLKIESHYSANAERSAELAKRRETIETLTKQFRGSVLALESEAFALYYAMVAYNQNKQYFLTVKSFREYKGNKNRFPGFMTDVYSEALYRIVLEKKTWLDNTDRSFGPEREKHENETLAEAMQSIKFFRKGFGRVLSPILFIAILAGIFYLFFDGGIAWGIIFDVIVLIVYLVKRHQCAFKKCKESIKRQNMITFEYKTDQKAISRRMRLCSGHHRKLNQYKKKLPMPAKIRMCIDDIRKDLGELASRKRDADKIEKDIKRIADQYS